MDVKQQFDRVVETKRRMNHPLNEEKENQLYIFHNNDYM